MALADRTFEAGDVVTHPAMNFRAIIAGWLVATAVAGMLYVAGLALGFSSFNAWNAGSSAKGIGIGTGIWMVVTWVVSLFLGGMFASWFDGRDDETHGSLHGVTVWGLSVVATGVWLALGLASGMGSHHPDGMHGGPAAMSGASAPAAMADHGAVAVLDANISYQLTGRERGGSAPIVAALLASQDDTATALLAADTGTTPAAASQTLARLSAQIAAARADAKEAADKAAHYTAMTLWIVFISSFLALLAAAFGGYVGSSHIHRVYHLRNYRRRRVS